MGKRTKPPWSSRDQFFVEFLVVWVERGHLRYRSFQAMRDAIAVGIRVSAFLRPSSDLWCLNSTILVLPWL